MCILEYYLFKKLNIPVTGRIVKDSEGILYESNIRQISLRLNCGEINCFTYGPEQFESLFVKARDCLEMQTRCLYLDTQRIGWIFPLSTLSSRSNIPQDSWVDLFLNFALWALIYDEKIYEHSLFPNSESGQFDILDFYPIESAVITLSKEALDKQNITSETVRLMLIKEGYLPLQVSNNKSALISFDSPNTDEKEKIKISNSSNDLLDLLGRFEIILSTAALETNPCSCFIMLYQIVEVLLSKIFEVSVDIYSSHAAIKTNPWLLREKLNTVANEKWRLDALLNRFVDPALNLTDIKEACINCLRQLETEEIENMDSPSVALYRVRNIVVHRQSDLHDNILDDLRVVNEALLQLIYNLLSNFCLSKGRAHLQQAIS